MCGIDESPHINLWGLFQGWAAHPDVSGLAQNLLQILVLHPSSPMKATLCGTSQWCLCPAAGPSGNGCVPVQSISVLRVKPLCLCAALQVLRSRSPTTWCGPSPSSGRWRCTPGSAPSSATSSSLPTPSFRIPPCHPTQPPTLSPSWRKLAGGWKRRKKGLENSPLSKGMMIWSDSVWEGCERLL